MALVSLGGIKGVPTMPTGGGLSAVVIDAGAEVAAVIFRAPYAATVTNIKFRTGSVVSTNRALRIGIQGVDMATGYNNGTWEASGNGYGTQASIAAGTTYNVALGASVSLVAGSMYAIVLKNDNEGDTAVAQFTSVSGIFTPGDYFNASGWQGGYSIYGINPNATKTQNLTCFTLLNGSTPISFPYCPIITSAMTAVSMASNGSVRESGNRIRLPYGARCIGIGAHLDFDQDCDLVLYDDTPTQLAAASLDSNVRPGTVAGGGTLVYFSSPVTLAANTWYRVVVKATQTTAANLSNYFEQDADSVAQMELGADCYRTYKDATTWYTETGKRSLIGLLIDQVDSGGSSGGSVGFGY